MNYPDFEKFTLYDESIVTIATNTSSPTVETLLDELYEAVQILEGIDTDVEYKTTTPQNGA